MGNLDIFHVRNEKYELGYLTLQRLPVSQSPKTILLGMLVLLKIALRAWT